MYHSGTNNSNMKEHYIKQIIDQLWYTVVQKGRTMIAQRHIEYQELSFDQYPEIHELMLKNLLDNKEAMDTLLLIFKMTHGINENKSKDGICMSQIEKITGQNRHKQKHALSYLEGGTLVYSTHVREKTYKTTIRGDSIALEILESLSAENSDENN